MGRRISTAKTALITIITLVIIAVVTGGILVAVGLVNGFSLGLVLWIIAGYLLAIFVVVLLGMLLSGAKLKLLRR